MAVLLFPDNTVLINFALINRMDLLERLANGSGQWCASVQQECQKSARREGLEALEDAAGIFGDPLFPETRAEHLNVRSFRLQLAAPDDPPTRHLGEAETLAIIVTRGLQAFFVTDDREAQRLALVHKVTAVDTWKLLEVAVRKGFVDAATIWGYIRTLRSVDRFVPHWVQRETIELWAQESEADSR